MRAGSFIRYVWILLAAAALASAQSIAFTFDDGPRREDTARMTPEGRNAALLGQLDRCGVKAALFLCVKGLDEGQMKLAAQWGAAGHMLGNHSATHMSLNGEGTSLQAFQEDMVACDARIRRLPGFARFFRFPYLKEGATPEKRDGFRAFLRSQGYRPAPVSIDASDWAYNLRLIKRLKENPKADLAPFRQAYLAHLWDRAGYYDRLAARLLKRPVRHVILLHHNLINALFIEDVIRMFRDKGWKVVDAREAFEDPLYRLEPGVLPAGESILWSLAKEAGAEGLRYPAEDGDYEEDAFRKWGL